MDNSQCESGICSAGNCSSCGSDCTCAGRWTVNASGDTVLDQMTGITWQRAASSGTVDWFDAQNVCSQLSLDGTGGWTLPSQAQLESLELGGFNASLTVGVGMGGCNLPANAGHGTQTCIDPCAFPDDPQDWYWSSTPSTSSVGYAWDVHFYDGDTSDFVMSGSARVRCVR